MSDPVGGVDWVSVQNTLYTWVSNAVSGIGPTAVSTVWAQQQAPRPAGPAIILRLSDISPTGRSWCDFQDNPQTFTTLTVASVSGNTLNFASPHGITTGNGPVMISSSGTVPPPLVADTDYWAIATSATALELAASYINTGGGQGSTNPITPITLTGSGSGTIQISPSTNGYFVAGQEQLAIAYGYLRVTLELHAYSIVGTGLGMAQSLLNAVASRARWPTQQALINGANIGLMEVGRVRAMYGTRDAVLFEPRAMLEVHLCVPTQEAAPPSTVITSVSIQDQITGDTSVYPIDDPDAG